MISVKAAAKGPLMTSQKQTRKVSASSARIGLASLWALCLCGCAADTATPPEAAPIVAAKSAKAAPVDTKAKPKKAKPKLDVAKIIKKDMDQNFGYKDTEPEWHLFIERLEVDGDTLKVHTSMFKSPIYKEIIGQTCGAASTYVFRPDKPEWGLSRLAVYSKDGQLLIWRDRLSDSCEP